MMACEYCKDGKCINSYSVNQTYIEDGELHMFWIDGRDSYDDNEPIRFCPMCGERLGDDYE